MKMLRIFFAMIALAVASLGMVQEESPSARFANNLVRSLQQTSREQFGDLFPTLSEFLQVMENNRELYGESLEAAKQEFSDEYNHHIAPRIVEQYESIQHSAATMRIDWSQVSILRVAADEGVDLEPRSMTIYFSANGDVHRLIIEAAFTLNGEWKVGGIMKLL